MHLGVAELVADIVEPVGCRQLTGALKHALGHSTPTTQPGGAARAASRVVSPIAHPMSTTSSPALISRAARRCLW